MTTERHIAVMGLLNDIEAPTKIYRSALRKAWRTATDGDENNAAKAKGNAALVEIEGIVRQWVADHPQTDGLDAVTRALATRIPGADPANLTVTISERDPSGGTNTWTGTVAGLAAVTP